MSKELQKAIGELKKRGVSTFPATVVSVDKANGTCTVNDGELEYTDVQLSAIIDGSKKQMFIYPVIGSSVLVSPIEEKLEWLYVEVYSEVESMSWQVKAGLFLKITADGIIIEAMDKPIEINSNNSTVSLSSSGIDISSDKDIRLNGGFEALYNKIPGLPISDFSQIGVAKKVKLS